MINCVVAVEQGQGIGYNGSMPWPHLRGDMKWFKELTTDQIVIMGSTTWKSLSKRLPNRVNMIIGRNHWEKADHCFFTPEDALYSCNLLYPEKQIFIIGGQALYDSMMSVIDRFYITEIEEKYQCDKFFNLSYVQANFPNIKIHTEYNDPINYKIKEYTK